MVVGRVGREEISLRWWWCMGGGGGGEVLLEDVETTVGVLLLV